MTPLEMVLWASVVCWVGGMVFWFFGLLPVTLQRLSHEEAGWSMHPIFPLLDTWVSVFGGVTLLLLPFVFQDRYLTPQAILLELPLTGMFLLSLHTALVLHPQMDDSRRRMKRSEYQGAVRLEMVRWKFVQLHRQSILEHAIVLVLGFLALFQLPGLL